MSCKKKEINELNNIYFGDILIFDENLAAVHAYLCADGYVIRNPPTQKHKYYYIALRNTNIILLKDFQDRFEKYFGIKPILKEGQRCKVQSKEIYHKLVKQFVSFYSWEWRMPSLSKKNMKFWLRAFFDCESYVEAQKGKSRTVRLECVNKTGLESVRNALMKHFDIESSIKERKGRNIMRLSICGKDDLLKFQKEIGFLHPAKSKKLEEAIRSFKR